MQVKMSIRVSAVMLLWLGACTGEQARDLRPTAETSAPQRVPQGLVYDLRGARLFIETSDVLGRILGRTYELADGTQIVIEYNWEGVTCIAAKARIKNKIIASGKAQRLAGNQTEGRELEVEELQYRNDGTVAYRGTSTFALGLTGEKIGEWPQEGRKLYEVFLKWGTQSYSANTFPLRSF